MESLTKWPGLPLNRASILDLPAPVIPQLTTNARDNEEHLGIPDNEDEEDEEDKEDEADEEDDDDEEDDEEKEDVMNQGTNMKLLAAEKPKRRALWARYLSLIHISEPTRRTPISYAVFC